MSKKPPSSIEHGTFTLEPNGLGGLRLTLNNTRYRVTQGIRKEMKVHAKQLGISVCFNETHNGNIFTLTEREGHRVKGSFEDRARKFATRYAPGGPIREDTVLASIKLAGAHAY